VLVAQYYPGLSLAGTGLGSGDPSMVVLSPIGQFQDTFSISTSSGAYSNFLSFVLPSGTTVMVDGVPLSSAVIGASGFDYANTGLTAGTHTISCAGTCAGSLLGISSGDTGDSYWHPLGAGFNPL
jgi:hypothetical protein